MQKYLLISEKGYWLPQGLGYTKSRAEAGRFSLDDMKTLFLDGVTLEAVR